MCIAWYTDVYAGKVPLAGRIRHLDNDDMIYELAAELGSDLVKMVKLTNWGII